MGPQLRVQFPAAADVAAAPLPTFAGAVLRAVDRLAGSRAIAQTTFLDQVGRAYADDSPEEVKQIAAEAWTWLSNRDFLCMHHHDGPGWTTLTRLGREAAGASDFGRWVADRAFSESLVHPSLHNPCISLFRQAEFDLAVLAAFKALEVAIREASGKADLIGTTLANEAFKAEGGPLADQAADKGERVSLMNLMSGAIGTFKNPQSHRYVGLDGPAAREMIVFASALLRIVDEARARRQRELDQAVRDGLIP